MLEWLGIKIRKESKYVAEKVISINAGNKLYFYNSEKKDKPCYSKKSKKPLNSLKTI